MEQNLPFQVGEGLFFLSRCSQYEPNEAGSPAILREKDIKE